jgi:hypothetical protein
MKKNLFIMALLLITVIGSRAQIHRPGAKIDLKETTDSQWHSLPSPASEAVPEASITCDGSEMFIYYRVPQPSMNNDEGLVKKWGGQSWLQYASLTNQCHSPDIDNRGSVFSATCYDDGNDYVYSSNINGPVVNFVGTYLMHQYNPRAAMAMGFPYMSFACNYSDGMPYSNTMLHAISPLGSGIKAEINGGWRIIDYDVGLKTDIAGDDNAWYCVYIQNEYLYVDKGDVVGGQSQYTYLGDGFRMYGAVSSPEIVVFNGTPVVAWFESDFTEIYIAEWNGSDWMVLGEGEIETGIYNTIRMECSLSDLYIAYTIMNADTNIFVNRYDGYNWYLLPPVQNQANSNIGTADIALYYNDPVVAFTENNQLQVKIYTDSFGLDHDGLNTTGSPINFFPNPFHENFTIDLGMMYHDVSYEIKDITGKRVNYKELEKAKVIDGTLEAAPGLYFIEIFTNDEKLGAIKIVKE